MSLTRRIRQWLPLASGLLTGVILTCGSMFAAALLPTLTLTSVSNGQVVSGILRLSAMANAAGLTGVRFQVSGVDVAPEVTAGACVVSWDTRASGEGTRTVVAIGRDSAGNTVSSAPVLVTVLNTLTDTTAPTVAMSSPASGTTVSGSVTLTANASDDTGVAGVWFAVDGNSVGSEDTLAPYTTSWSTAGVPNGTHVLTATARDASGNSSTSASVVVTVSNASNDSTAPNVALTAPAGGTTVTGLVNVTANATDNVGVVGVQFTLDNVNIGSEVMSAPYTLSWTSNSATNGAHALRAIARDAAGNSTTSTAVTVTVSNVVDTTAPTVSLTAPASGATVSGTITLSASASDNVGVAGVRFTLDNNNIGTEDTTSPYSITWNSGTVANGAHTLRAIARDLAGNTKTSTARTITISNAADLTAPTVSISAPTTSATVAGQITVTAAASDNVGVAGVQFQLDGANIGTEDTTAPFQYSWPTNLTLNGSHALTAVARDGAGNTRTSAAVTVTVNNQGSGVPGDFNGDGFPDLIFESATGQLYAWFMNGSALIGEGGLVPGAVLQEWRIVGVDDFNGDKRPDLLWQHAVTGQLYIWLMDKLTMIGQMQPQSALVDWRVATTGDFNGDGKTDIVWKHRVTGQLYVWFMDGATMIGGGSLTPQQVLTTWRIAGAADFNHDGQSDLIWQNTVTGQLTVWIMSGLRAVQYVTPTPGAVSTDWQLQGTADYDRDGNPDLVWQNSVTGQLYIWYMNGTNLLREGFLTPSQVALTWQVVGGK